MLQQELDRLLRDAKADPALKAALLVVGVMCAGLTLFLLFAQFIWFR